MLWDGTVPYVQFRMPRKIKKTHPNTIEKALSTVALFTLHFAFNEVFSLEFVFVTHFLSFSVQFLFNEINTWARMTDGVFSLLQHIILIFFSNKLNWNRLNSRKKLHTHTKKVYMWKKDGSSTLNWYMGYS